MGVQSIKTVLRRMGFSTVVLSSLLVVSSQSPALGDTGCPTAVAPTAVSGIYEIDTAAKLQWAKDTGAMSNNYKLTANVSMSGCTWTSGIGTTGSPYSGIFDGNNKTISNLTVNNTGSQSIALIDALSGSVSDLTLSSPSVTGTSNYVGSIVGDLRSTGSVSRITLTSVSVSGGQSSGGAIGQVQSGAAVTTLSVSGSFDAPNGSGGGAFGTVEGTVSNVTSSVTVTGSYNLGGLSGNLYNAGTISNSTSTGNVTGSSSSVGGAVGFVAGTSPTCGTLTEVTTSGNITGNGSVGGLIGYVNCYKVERSSSSAVVTLTSTQAGGLVGYENIGGSITKSFFTGQVQATEQVGGIAGASRSTITDSYSTGSVTATSATNGGRIGALVGWLLSGANITRTYATGSVTPPSGDNSTVGGLIGNYGGGTITSSIWNTQTTGRSTSQGTGAKGYTSQQMKDYVLYDPDNLNWGITDGISSGNGVTTGTTWSICSSVNSGYPFLTLQSLSGSCLPTMAYMGNGNTAGTAPTDGSTPYTSGSTVTVLDNTGSMTKTSNVFSGWNTKADGTGTSYAPGETFTITSPVMLFAQWTSTPTISYRSNGGSGTITSTTGASGSSVTLSSGAGFSRVNYTLTRWDTSSTGNGVSYSKSQVITMPAGGLTLYAIWTALPSITYNSNGGTGTIAATYAASGASVTLSSGSSFTRTNYLLSRWDTSSTGNGVSYSKSQAITMPAGGLTLYAVWAIDPASTTTTTTSTTSTTSTTTTTTPASGSTSTSVAVPTNSTTPSFLPQTAIPTIAPTGSASTAPRNSSTSTVAAEPAPTISTTSTTSVPAPTEEAPDIEDVTSGNIGATVNGKTVAVNIREENGSLIATVGGGRIALTVTGSDGLPRRLALGTVRSMSYGDQVQLDLAGFASDSEATAWVTPDGIVLGETTLTNGAGIVKGAVTESITPGERRITIATKSSRGEPIVVAYGVRMSEKDSSNAPWSRVFFVILALAVVSGLLVPAAKRRRREE